MSFSFFAPTTTLYDSTLFSSPTSAKGRGGGEGTFELTTPPSSSFRPSTLLPAPYFAKPEIFSPLDYSFGGEAEGYGPPDWMSRSGTFPHLSTLTTTSFPVPSYQLAGDGDGEEGLFASDLSGIRGGSSVGGSNNSTSTSPTSTNVLPFDPDPEMGLVDDPDKIKVGPGSGGALKGSAKVEVMERPKRRCAAPAPVESDGKKARKVKKVVKVDSEDEGDDGSEFDPDEMGADEAEVVTGGKQKRVKKSATERRERRKATNRASAKAFRARRKNMLADIQAQIGERDEEISNLRSLIGRLKDERVTLVSPVVRSNATPAAATTRSSYAAAAAAKRPSSAP